jgi:hypothetical protein
MTIDPLTEIVLRHSVRHIDVAESGHIAAISTKGCGSLISPDHIEATSFQVSFDPNDLAIAANGSPLAVTSGSGMTIINLDPQTDSSLRRFIRECSFHVEWSTVVLRQDRH